MRKSISIPLFALAGALICLAAIPLTDKLEVTPHFPAFAGEDDFALRTRYFLFTVFPAFVITGGWIGYVFSQNKRLGSCMWLGVIGGSIATFSMAHFLSPTINAISSRDTANHSVLALFIGWVGFSALGAFAVRFAFRNRAG